MLSGPLSNRWPPEEWMKVEVIGVIEDYRMAPYILEEGSTESVTGRGQCLTYLNSGWPAYVPNRISLKLNNEFSNISEVEKLYNQLFPGNIFKWYFLDENINRLYGDQKIARNQITLFTVIAIAVACLGLLGMISNKVVERNKEMSIRRILGARYHQVVCAVVKFNRRADRNCPGHRTSRRMEILPAIS